MCPRDEQRSWGWQVLLLSLTRRLLSILWALPWAIQGAAFEGRRWALKHNPRELSTYQVLWTKLPLSPICCPCATPSFQTHEKLNQNPTGRRPLVIQFCLIPSTPPRSAKAFLDPLAFPALQAEPVITPTNIHWGFWAAALWEPAPSQELHTLYKASSWLLEPHSQGSVQSSGCCWQEPSLCAAMSQALQKWWKCEFCSLLLDTIALRFQWLNFFQKLHALEQWSELFKTLLYMSVLSQQLL